MMMVPASSSNLALVPSTMACLEMAGDMAAVLLEVWRRSDVMFNSFGGGE